MNTARSGMSTDIQGTIFVTGNAQHPNDRHIRIVATLDIDLRDWSGITIGFPGSWRIKGVTSSYPEGKPSQFSYISTMGEVLQPDASHPVELEIGGTTSPGAGAAGGGGHGSLLVDMQYALPKTTPPGSVVFTISGGGLAGSPYVGIVSTAIRVEVPLALNGQVVNSFVPYTTEILGPYTGPPPVVTAITASK
jgi:hypothetical protein